LGSGGRRGTRPTHGRALSRPRSLSGRALCRRTLQGFQNKWSPAPTPWACSVWIPVHRSKQERQLAVRLRSHEADLQIKEKFLAFFPELAEQRRCTRHAWAVEVCRRTVRIRGNIRLRTHVFLTSAGIGACSVSVYCCSRGWRPMRRTGWEPYRLQEAKSVVVQSDCTISRPQRCRASSPAVRTNPSRTMVSLLAISSGCSRLKICCTRTRCRKRTRSPWVVKRLRSVGVVLLHAVHAETACVAGVASAAAHRGAPPVAPPAKARAVAGAVHAEAPAPQVFRCGWAEPHG